MSNSFGAIRGQITLDVKQALSAYTSVRQEHVSTVTALSTGGGAIAASGALIAGAGIAMGAGLMVAVNAAAEFERKLDFFTAVSGATQAEYEAIREKALQLGADTIYSADQIADAFVELSKSGVSTQDVINGIGDAVANLGAATDMPLEEAATSLTTVLNTFGLSAEDAVSVVDKLAGAANSSAIDVEDLITTLTYAGASAATAGISFEDVNSAIALLGERGIKGSKAGTGLRQMFDKLIAPTQNGTAALKELGIITEDGTNQLLNMDGTLKPIPDLLDALNGSLAGLTTSEKMDLLGQIFPITSLPTILNLLDAGSAGLAELNEQIGKTTAMDIASERLDNLSGDLEILKGNLDTLMITAGSGFQSFARGIVQGITAMLQWFMDLSPGIQQAILWFIAGSAALLILIGTFGLLAGSLLNIIGLWIRVTDAIKVLGVIAKATAPFIRILMLSFLPGPLGPLLIIFTLLGAALAYFFTQTATGQAVWAQFMAIMQQFMASIGPALSTIVPTLIQFATTLGGMLAAGLQAIIPLLAIVGNFFLTILGPILPIITQLLTGLGNAFANVGTQGAEGMQGILNFAASLVAGIINAIPVIITAVVQLVTLILAALISALPLLITAGLQLFTGLIQAMTAILPQIIAGVIQMVTGILQALVSALPLILTAAIQMFTGLITALVQIIPQLITSILQAILQIVTALVAAIPMLLEAGLTLFMGLVQAIPQVIPPLIEAVVGMLPILLGTLISMIPMLIEAAIQLFMALVQAIPEIIPPLIEGVINLIPILISTVISLIPQLIQAAVQLFTALVTAIPKIIPKLITAIIDLVPKIISTLISAVPQLIQAAITLFMAIVQAVPQIVGALVGALSSLGRQMIQGLVNGVGGMAKAVLNAVMGVVGGAVNAVKSFLGIKSPSRLMIGFGVNTILGLIKGVHQERGALVKEMLGVANDLAGFYNQVGAAAELDASLRTATSVGVESPSLQAQLNELSLQLQKIAEKDTINIEEYNVNNPEPETESESLPNTIRKASYLVG